MTDLHQTTPQGSTPVPDPTLLTTQQTERSIAGLREILEAMIHELRVVGDTRHKAMDEAIRLVQVEREKFPNLIDQKIDHASGVITETFKLVEEKFNSVALQFKERDTRSER